MMKNYRKNLISNFFLRNPIFISFFSITYSCLVFFSPSNAYAGVEDEIIESISAAMDSSAKENQREAVKLSNRALSLLNEIDYLESELAGMAYDIRGYAKHMLGDNRAACKDFKKVASLGSLIPKESQEDAEYWIKKVC
tara:strand:+ start:170 stop:586 length:417 start_codon:yes stop_codon:yes gene_type:complete